MLSVGEIFEPDIKLEGKSIDDLSLRQLYCKNELVYRFLADFWKPLIKNGKMYFNYMHGEIFDKETRDEYEQVLNKIVIEPKIMKPRINSIVGQLIQGKRSGKIVTEGGASAAEISTGNLMLKYFENKIDEEALIEEMLFNGCVSCCPQITWFDIAKTAYGDQIGGLIAEVLDWDSFVLSDRFKKADFSDVDTIIRIARQSMRELIEENPERESQIKEFYKDMKDRAYTLGDMIKGTAGLNIDDARYLNYDAITAISNARLDGRLLTRERLMPVKINHEVAIATESEEGNTIDYQIKPGTWSDARWEKWKRQNSNKYMTVKIPVPLLWRVRWTAEGLVLKNELHWFQEHNNSGNPMLPIAGFVAQIVDGKPTGPGADMQHKILLHAIAQTEYLHAVRSGAGDVFLYRAGSVNNYEDLPTELSIGNGVVEVADNLPGRVTDHINILKRTPNQTYAEYSQMVKSDLDDEDLINKGVMGMHVPDQSGKAKNTEIAQALIGYSFLRNNFNKSYFRIKNMECMLIPYVFTEEETIELTDDDNQEIQRVGINQKNYDVNGEVSHITNDLSSCKWRWRLIPGDDSPTAREAELREMLLFWNTAAPSLIEADNTLGILSSVLMSMSNKTANETGRLIAEKAQVQAERMNQQEMARLMAELEERKAKAGAEQIKAMRSGFSFSITPEDIAFIPGMYEILVNGNYINTANNNAFQLPQTEQAAAAA